MVFPSIASLAKPVGELRPGQVTRVAKQHHFFVLYGHRIWNLAKMRDIFIGLDEDRKILQCDKNITLVSPAYQPASILL